MEELILLVFQVVVELVLEVLFGSGSTLGSAKRSDQTPSVVKRCIAWGIGGCFLGFASTFLFETAWLKALPLQVANLVIAPIASAYVAKAIAEWRDERSTYLIDARLHFWQAFWFTLAMVGVRFAMLRWG